MSTQTGTIPRVKVYESADDLPVEEGDDRELVMMPDVSGPVKAPELPETPEDLYLHAS